LTFRATCRSVIRRRSALTAQLRRSIFSSTVYEDESQDLL
jgi:hypothetical protein